LARWLMHRLENYRVPPRTFECDPMVSNERNPPKAV
jgi:hypothetical protein